MEIRGFGMGNSKIKDLTVFLKVADHGYSHLSTTAPISPQQMLRGNRRKK